MLRGAESRGSVVNGIENTGRHIGRPPADRGRVSIQTRQGFSNRSDSDHGLRRFTGAGSESGRGERPHPGCQRAGLGGEPQPVPDPARHPRPAGEAFKPEHTRRQYARRTRADPRGDGSGGERLRAERRPVRQCRSCEHRQVRGGGRGLSQRRGGRRVRQTFE